MRLAGGAHGDLLRQSVTPQRASAHAAALTSDERALALAVAKVAANEASLDRIRPSEVALIYQATEAHGGTARERLRWLRAHSNCVLGERGARVERPGNCSWTSNLDDSDGEPLGWSEAYPHLRWSRYVERWRQVRALARRLVSGELVLRPCPTTPWTWGGPMDHERALERGLVPIDCRDERGEPTRNTGYVRVARSGDAS